MGPHQATNIFLIGIAVSMGIHALVFSLSNFLDVNSFKLALVKGEPFEISRATQPSKPLGRNIETPIKNATTSPTPTLPEETPQDTREGKSKDTGKIGISDGSEFGISKPRYPEGSRLRGEEGRVLLKLTFDNTNSLVKVEVTQSSGFPDLDRAALSQVERDLAPSQSKIHAFQHFVQFNFLITTPK